MRESERERETKREKERKRERVCVRLCACVGNGVCDEIGQFVSLMRERESERERKRKRKRKRKRERECVRVRVRVCVCVCVCVRTHACFWRTLYRACARISVRENKEKTGGNKKDRARERERE